jgi:hypothetical protein
MVPLTAPVKATAVVLAPLHMVCAVGVLTVGVGFTVILKFCEVPIQPLAVGITMTLAVSGVAPAFIAVKEAILPVPDAPRPMPGSVLVQPYVVPLTAPLKFTAVEAMPLHNTWLVGAVTVGVGFTVITKLAVLPVHPCISSTSYSACERNKHSVGSVTYCLICRRCNCWRRVYRYGKAL